MSLVLLSDYEQKHRCPCSSEVFDAKLVQRLFFSNLFLLFSVLLCLLAFCFLKLECLCLCVFQDTKLDCCLVPFVFG